MRPNYLEKISPRQKKCLRPVGRCVISTPCFAPGWCDKVLQINTQIREGEQVMAKPKERHRRSVSLVPGAKDKVDRIAEVKGISVNRAIEAAVEFYSNCLRVEEQEDGQIVGFMLRTSDGSEKKVHVLV
jgi:hypothetical protein